MSHFETTLSSKTIFEGKILSLQVDTVQLENGAEATREVVVHHGGVAVLALDSDDNILLVEQFRYPSRQELLEIPAGKRNQGEDPAECGRRELEEETGYRAGEFTSLGSFLPTAAYDTEVIYLYLAKQLTPTAQRLDEDEFLTLRRIPFARAVELCMDGTITDGKTLIAILKYAAMRGAAHENCHL